MEIERMADKIRVWDTGKLTPYRNNSRTHSQKQIAEIKESIVRFGFNNPILVDSKKGIIAGHGRFVAARELGLEKVPVVILDHLSEQEKRAYIIADNKITDNAGWDEELLKAELQDLDFADFDLAGLGFSEKELDVLLEPNIDLDRVRDSAGKDEEVGEIAHVAEKGDLWQLGRHRLVCGDSANAKDVLLLLGDRKLDMIFTDPPCGVSYAEKNEFLNSQDKGNRIQKEIANDHMTPADTGNLWARAFGCWRDAMKKCSSYYICSPQRGDLFLMMMMQMQENGFPLRHCLIWNKNNHVLGRCDYMYKHEPILYGWQNTHKYYGKGDHTKSVWDIAKPLRNDLHPTMKPVELVVNAIMNSTLSGMRVGDMFAGSGSTLIACENTDRICYAMELEEEYCDVILARWEMATGEKAQKQKK